MKAFYERYTFSPGISEQLSIARSILEDDSSCVESAWMDLGTEIETRAGFTKVDNDRTINDESQKNTGVHQQPAAQFYLSQSPEIPRKGDDDGIRKSIGINDTVESIYESLEHNNGKLELCQLGALSDGEMREMAGGLHKRLSVRGFYNLCCSMTKMNDEQKARYVGPLCTGVLLPKICNTGHPSTLILAAIKECAEKITEDIQQFVFLPLLNLEIKDTTVVNTFFNSIDLRRRKNFFKIFCSTVKELKTWHTSVLLILLSTNIEADSKDRLINLLSQKALYFCTDKNYGKLVLSFLKTNSPFSTEQKNSLLQIATVNKTVYRRPMTNILCSL